ncbi:hypothetical protein [Pyxidicoccus parkwayensis]|nr:hypothetical protein [Pyxidicoccus parkwaysis]
MAATQRHPAMSFRFPRDVHEVINQAYPACYAKDGKWRAIGPDLPYSD